MKDDRIKSLIKERLRRCVRLRELGVGAWVIKHEQLRLLRHRRGYLSLGRTPEIKALMDKHVRSKMDHEEAE